MPYNKFVIAFVPFMMVTSFAHAKAAINEKDTNGKTALMRAATAGNAQEVHDLIKAGADLNLIDNHTDTALEQAICKATEIDTIIKKLIQAGTKSSATGLMECPVYGRDRHDESIITVILFYLAENSDLSVQLVPTLLTKMGVKVSDFEFLIKKTSFNEMTKMETLFFDLLNYVKKYKNIAFAQQIVNYLKIQTQSSGNVSLKEKDEIYKAILSI